MKRVRGKLKSEQCQILGRKPVRTEKEAKAALHPLASFVMRGDEVKACRRARAEPFFWKDTCSEAPLPSQLSILSTQKFNNLNLNALKIALTML